MSLDERFPAVSGFLRWATGEIRSGSQTPEQIVRIAIQRYSGSPAFLEAFVKEAFLFFAIEAATGRKPDLGTQEPIDANNALVDRIRESRAKRASRIAEAKEPNNELARFFEKHPSLDLRVPLLIMTREELLLAAASRDRQSLEHRRRAELCRKLADGLKPGQIAKERYTEDDIARIEKTLFPAPTPIGKSA